MGAGASSQFQGIGRSALGLFMNKISLKYCFVLYFNLLVWVSGERGNVWCVIPRIKKWDERLVR